MVASKLKQCQWEKKGGGKLCKTRGESKGFKIFITEIHHNPAAGAFEKVRIITMHCLMDDDDCVVSPSHQT